MTLDSASSPSCVHRQLQDPRPKTNKRPFSLTVFPSIFTYFKLDSSSYLTGRQAYCFSSIVAPESILPVHDSLPSVTISPHKQHHYTTGHQEALLHIHPGYQSKNGQALRQGERRLLASFQERRERRARPQLRYFLLNLPPFRGRSTIIPPCCSGATTSLPSLVFPAGSSCKQAFGFTAQNIPRKCQRDRQNPGRWHETDGWCRRSIIIHGFLRAYTTYGATIWDVEEYDRSDYESIARS